MRNNRHTYAPYWSNIANSICTCGLARVYCIRINGEPQSIPKGLHRYTYREPVAEASNGR